MLINKPLSSKLLKTHTKPSFKSENNAFGDVILKYKKYSAVAIEATAITTKIYERRFNINSLNL